MKDPDQPERDEKVLKKLARLFVEIPESTDPAEIDSDLRAQGVDVVRLGHRISEIVQTAAEKERLVWLDEYRQEISRKGSPKVATPRAGIPKTRQERLQRIEELQTRLAGEGLPVAVGFKKLQDLSDEDLTRILTVLQEQSEEPSRSS